MSEKTYHEPDDPPQTDENGNWVPPFIDRLRTSPFAYDGSMELARWLEHHYEHTEEYENGEYSMSDWQLKTNAPIPYFSDLPIVGKYATVEVDFTHVLVIAIWFGMRWERDYPHGRTDSEDDDD